MSDRPRILISTWPGVNADTGAAADYMAVANRTTSRGLEQIAVAEHPTEVGARSQLITALDERFGDYDIVQEMEPLVLGETQK